MPEAMSIEELAKKIKLILHDLLRDKVWSSFEGSQFAEALSKAAEEAGIVERGPSATVEQADSLYRLCQIPEGRRKVAEKLGLKEPPPNPRECYRLVAKKFVADKYRKVWGPDMWDLVNE